jgi:ferredoxin-NADP reductase
MPSFEASLLETIKRTECKECPETRSYRFENSTNIQYRAGQFFFITIQGKDREYRHHFSFSSSPTEEEYLEFTTKLRNSEFKHMLQQLKIGDKVVLKAPFGDFTFQENLEKIAMISGGIGITPLRSICKYGTDNKFSNNIILLYSNHSEDDIAFREDFDHMCSLNRNLKVVYTVSDPSDSWKHYVGRINVDMMKTEIPDYLERTFYLSGPSAMNSAMKQLLTELNVPKPQIKIETFTGY